MSSEEKGYRFGKHDPLQTHKDDTSLPAVDEAILGKPAGKKLSNRSRALAFDNEGNLSAGKFVVTPKGLKIAEDVSQEDWEIFGDVILRFNGTIQWLLGDWLAYGENHQYGKTYEEVADLTGYKVETLYNFVWVAKRIDISSRNENLSFKHHFLVASFEDKETQEAWLQTAAESNWSTRTLQTQIAGKRPTPLRYHERVLYRLAQQNQQLIDIRNEKRKIGQGAKSQISQALRQLGKEALELAAELESE